MPDGKVPRILHKKIPKDTMQAAVSSERRECQRLLQTGLTHDVLTSL